MFDEVPDLPKNGAEQALEGALKGEPIELTFGVMIHGH